MLISPSLLAADFGNLNADIIEIEPHVDRWHIDVMDGVFVPNISYGYPVIACLKTETPLDVHLMVTQPEILINQLGPTGKVKNLSTHIELGGEKTREMMKLTRSFGIEFGIAINPPTDVEALRELIYEVDYVLIMSVNPGFGGQSFMPEVLEKAKILRKWRPDIELHIDGGVSDQTIGQVKQYDFDLVVSGSYVFKAEDRVGALEKLRM